MRGSADSNGQVLDLGDVTTTLRAHGSGFAGTVANTGGDAELSGDLVLSPRGNGVDLTVTPRDPHPQPFMQALALLGTPASGGGTRNQMAGSAALARKRAESGAGAAGSSAWRPGRRAWCGAAGDDRLSFLV